MIENFMTWLNTEIDDLRRYKGNNLMLDGKFSEAIRIRQMICDMAHDEKSIQRDELERVADEICRRYCRFPEAYPEGENERMIEEKCNHCPLGRLVE